MNINIGDFFLKSSELSNVTIYSFSNAIEEFIFGEGRLSLKLLGIYFFISFFFYLLSKAPNKKITFKNAFEFIFPKKIYTHPSTRMDFFVFLARSIFNPAKVLTFWVVLMTLSKIISEKFGIWFPPTWDRLQPSALNLFLISLAGFLLFDFIQYILHRSFHQISILWPFHAPHHSAEVLNPFTVQREHFVWEIFENFLLFSLFGIAQGILIWATIGSVNPRQIFEYTIIFNIFNYIVGNFHHTHIWISFGFLDRIFVSPAIHHIHHSVDPKHRNKNYGYFLSLWDQMFGTIYVPKEKENLVYGIEKGVKNPHDTLFKFYFLPFKESALVIKNIFQKIFNFPISKSPVNASTQRKKSQVQGKVYKKEKSGSFQQVYKLK